MVRDACPPLDRILGVGTPPQENSGSAADIIITYPQNLRFSYSSIYSQKLSVTVAIYDVSVPYELVEQIHPDTI